MTNIDLNYWGLLVVPVGVSICFFPALLIWIWREVRARKERESPPRQPTRE